MIANWPCWIWVGRTIDGYGRMEVRGRNCAVHRLAWEAMNGPIPAGLELHHACKNRACYKPSHLVPLSRKQHGLEARQDECRNGHKMVGHNVKKHPNGKRKCRECLRQYIAAYYRKNIKRKTIYHKDHYRKNRERILERRRLRAAVGATND